MKSILQLRRVNKVSKRERIFKATMPITLKLSDNLRLMPVYKNNITECTQQRM